MEKVKCLRCGDRTRIEDATQVAGTDKYICSYCRTKMKIISSEYKFHPESEAKKWHLIAAAVLIVLAFTVSRFCGELRGMVTSLLLTAALVFLIFYSFTKKRTELLYQSTLQERNYEKFTPTFFSKDQEFCLNCGSPVSAEDDNCPCCNAVLDRTQNEE